MQEPAQTPPPMPANAGRPVKRAVFKEVKRSMMVADFDFGLIEASHAKAEAWINANPHIEIVQIETFHSGVYGITVVWHR